MRHLISSSILAAAALIGPAPAASAAPTAAPAVAAPAMIPIGTVVIYNGHGWLWNGFQWVVIF